MSSPSLPLLGLLPIEIHGTQFRNTIRYALGKGLRFTALLPQIQTNLEQVKTTALKLITSNLTEEARETEYLSALHVLQTSRLWMQFLVRVQQEARQGAELEFAEHQKLSPLYQAIREIQELLDPVLPLVLEHRKKRPVEWTDVLQKAIRTMQTKTELMAKKMALTYRLVDPKTYACAELLVARFFADFMQKSEHIAQYIATHYEEWSLLSLREGRDLLIPKPDDLPGSFLFSTRGNCYPLIETVEHLLGKGSDKIVFRAIALPQGAIKAIMKPTASEELIDVEKKTKQDKSQLFNMWTESELLLKLKNKTGIIQIDERMVFEIGEKKQLFLVEDYYWDGSLHDYFSYTMKRGLKEGLLSAHKQHAILLQTLQGLASIHEAGIVHHDIKPDNILFDDSEAEIKVVLADFQLAAFAQDRLRLDYLRCRAAWTSPEYAQLKRLEDPKKRYSSLAPQPIDIWSLGAVFYVLVTQSFPPWFQTRSKPTQPPPPTQKDKPPEKSGDTDEVEAQIFARVAELQPDWFPEQAIQSPYFPLLKRMLDINPATRCSAAEALALLNTLQPS